MRTLALAFVAVCAIASTFAGNHAPLLVWNASTSAPIGYYAVRPAGALAITDLIVARPPEPLAEWLAARGYLPKSALLIKRVAALPGQKVCRTDLTISVDGSAVAEANARDHVGRDLPRWSGCFKLRPGEVFLLNWDHPASLDGRYFGVLPVDSIVGRAQPIWTEAE
ncbi:S26 family signal peptidase [Methylocystis parvus]|uniref:S26 family signal peptidase n=1 Tax=Methylocystis parvus TaxID=134 RepID=A0A6B8M2Y9_9HYPH|nr:S26 family signal peptidase [Methylocystis parvus]QGM97271.1 S26 family signal peptidase [Methylocystis parvus]WBJ98816.1 S26 family signal peptidase [Methylocystis parvus OBBP]